MKTLRELIQDIEVTSMTADPGLAVRDVRYDSRAVEPGDLFVAVRGLQTDGHRYIRAALDRGAAAVLCEEPPEVDGPYIVTPDSRLALALVSGAYFDRPSNALTMVGVTGTNGKTTSTTLIKHILEQCVGAKVGLIGTIANYIGDEELPTARTTPESYELQKLLRRMADAGCTHVVMEVSSHALSLDRVAGIQFQAGLFTNLTRDHLDFHGTMRDYAAAKAKLFTISDAGAVNVDDAWSPFMGEQATCPMLSFSATVPADLWARDIEMTASGVRFTATCGQERAAVTLAIPGRFSVENALTALAAGVLLGIPLEEAAAALGTAGGVKGRVEVVPTPADDLTVIIDYAHTPDALEKVLKTIKAVSPGRLVALFGCGGDRDRTKRPIMGRAAADIADFLVVTSDNPRTEEPEAIIADIVEGIPADTPHVVIPDRAAAIAWAIERHEPGDVLVLAGKGHETYQEVNGVKNHMDERELVAACFAGTEGI